MLVGFPTSPQEVIHAPGPRTVPVHSQIALRSTTRLRVPSSALGMAPWATTLGIVHLRLTVCLPLSGQLLSDNFSFVGWERSALLY